MTPDDWLSQFEDELKKLRPHLSDHLPRQRGTRKRPSDGGSVLGL